MVVCAMGQQALTDAGGRLIRSQVMPKPRFRRRLLRCLQGALYWTGIGWAYVNMQRIGGAVVLIYHSVVGPGDERWIDPRYSVRADVFDAQMSFLARHRRVISVGDLANALAHRKGLPGGSVVITFDDGYRNNLDVAIPILERYRLPAIVYLATGYVERREAQWVDRLYTMFNERTRDKLALTDSDPLRWDLRFPLAVKEAHAYVAGKLLTANRAARENLLRNVVEQLRPAARAPRLTLTWDEVRRLVRMRCGLEIGVHTVNHVDLSSCDAGTARAEVEESIEDVRRELGRKPEHFSYPYGRVPQWTRRILVECGFRSAMTCGPGLRVDESTDVLAVPRLDPVGSLSFFRYATSGAHPGLTKALIKRA